jgi:membrane protease YdiL (CAAX protease family)
MRLVLDLAVVLAFAVVSPLISWKIEYPRLLADVARGDRTARSRAYRRTVIEQWLFVVAALAVWLGFGRPAATLGLHLGHPGRIAIGMAVAIAVVLFLAAQRRALLAHPHLFAAVRDQLGSAGPLVPHTADERRRWIVLSITAGICEEILFRGYLTTLLASGLGPVAGAAVSCLMFGLAHLYLGARGAFRAGLAGVVMAVVVALTGSLWVAMVLHAAIDMHSGALGSAAMTAAPEPVAA